MIRKTFSVLVALFFSTVLVGTAAANCGGDTCLDEMTPTYPSETFDLSILVESFGGVAGIGQVNGIGDEFVGRVDKESSLVLNTNLTYDSDLCGAECGDGRLTFTGSALESIDTIGAAISTTPGEEVAVGNLSTAQSLLGINLKIGGNSTEASPNDD